MRRGGEIHSVEGRAVGRGGVARHAEMVVVMNRGGSEKDAVRGVVCPGGVV
jgi:hypothetical protein